MQIRFTPLVLGLIAAATLPATSLAQSAGTQSDVPQPAVERRPFRGIFSGLSRPSTPQSLVFSGSLFGAYDDNVLAGVTERDARDWRLQRSGAYAGAQAGLQYIVSRVGQRTTLGASAGGQLSYYRNAEISNFAPDYHADAAVGVRLSRSTTMDAGHRFGYSRYYRLLRFASGGEVVENEPSLTGESDFGLFHLPSVRNSTHASLTQAFGRHASLRVGYLLRSVNFLADDASETSLDQGSERQRLEDYRTQAGSVRFQYSRPLTSHATLNLGYGIRISDGRRATGEPQTMHDVNAGVGYGRALSFSRRTSVNFSTGSAIAVTDEIGEDGSGSRTYFRLIGNAALRHELGRTWTAHASYYRGFVFQEGFDEPFSTDGVTVGIAGLVTRRLSFSAAGAWALSTLNRSGQTGQNAFTGNAQSTFALKRYLAVFAQYVYYTYAFDADVPLDPRFPRALDRQALRVGIATSVPLIR